ncbi:hypothetical protein [Amycolatopsis sp. YIM 10]|uniref:hypothetical protein n=1 Tax=Amycolatopsis sp. YIM 10 TaxID=2653857 RepID=UPI0012903624|nr:hypothetical protein [Amycolatopsis sp. YIM 10]QFU86657.1 hypothetical protein YIM_07230 [Amycolatopsis sp. YIM 10]
MKAADRAKRAAETGSDLDQERELRQLRKRVAELEKEILRKAAAYFAQKMGR